MNNSSLPPLRNTTFDNLQAQEKKQHLRSGLEGVFHCPRLETCFLYLAENSTAAGINGQSQIAWSHVLPCACFTLPGAKKRQGRKRSVEEH